MIPQDRYPIIAIAAHAMDDSPSQSSPAADEELSTCGTPDGRRDSANENNDTNLVIGAGRSLKTMLADLTSVLEVQAKTQVFITGQMHLRIEGREEYTLSLVMEDKNEPSSLRVMIEKGGYKPCYIVPA